MKNKSWLALMLILFIATFTVGCAGENDPEAMQAAEVYTKSLEAMQEANSYAFDMEVAQTIKFPEPVPMGEGVTTDTMETQIKGTGKAIQKPLAMDMVLNMHIPAMANIPEAAKLADMEMKFFVAENKMYMYCGPKV